VEFHRENTMAGARTLERFSVRVSLLQRLGVSYLWKAVAVLPLWAALCISVAQAQVPTSGPSSGPFAGAIVSEWKGKVHVQLPGASVSPPMRGQVLPEGTLLDTGDGRLMLVLRADESEILIQPHTRLVVREPASGNWNALEVLLGRVRAYIRKRTGGAPAFQMGTPSAVIAVRGTRFDVEVNGRGVTEVDVFDGLVEVAAPTIVGSSVLVSPGFSTRVGIGTAPEPAVPTREIRPDVEASNEMAKKEFARERASQAERTWDSELGERPDSELDEVVGESRESEKGKQ
jgi:hypothetical protein